MKKKYYWIYGIVVIVFIAVPFFVSNSNGPVETNWSKVKSTMLASQDIERIVVVNNKQAKIYIKKDRIKNYEQEFNGNFSKPSDAGPHFVFNIGSIETFERNLSIAQEGSTDEILPEYIEENSFIPFLPFNNTGTLDSIIIVFFVLVVYFIPAMVAKGNKNLTSIFILNLLLGWTIFGWIGALIWATSTPNPKNLYKHICSKCGYEKAIDQKVKLFVCPNCNTENIIEKE